ncbi:HPr family phosphocarrier protein [Pontiellaceae bacterium B12227]|nr:HPr family phosphocarrier protein [Pontiellaceae bacterium B12227]
MTTFTEHVTVKNRIGLHMYPVAEISKIAHNFDAIVALYKGNKIAHGHSVVEMLMLGAFYGDTIKISAIGNDAEQALRAIVDYVSSYTDDQYPKGPDLDICAA